MVGEILKREREKQNFTIDDIAKETSISKKYIEALEKGEYDSMPGDVYVKGFIRNYSKFLNMDGDILLSQYASERGISKPIQPVDKKENRVEEPEEEAEAKQEPLKMRVTPGQGPVKQSKSSAFSSGADFRNRVENSGISAKKIVMALGGAVVLFLAAVYIIFSDESTAPGANQAKPEVKQEEAVKEAPKPAPAANEVKVSVKLLEASWMEVKVDGQVAYEGTAQKGIEMNWSGKDKITITAGNAGGVELTWNDKKIGVLGNVGDVVERTMTKDSDGSAPAAAAPAPAQQAPAAQSYNAAPAVNEAPAETPAAPAPVEPAASEAAPAALAPEAAAPAPTMDGNGAAKTN